MSKHDKDNTIQISTTGEDQKDEEEFAKASEVDADQEDYIGEGEESIQRLESFHKFGKDFVRSLSFLVEDVGGSSNYRQKFLEVLADCFANIIRLSNTITGCNGPSLKAFIDGVIAKVSQIGESQAQTQNQQEERQEEIDRSIKEATKVLFQDVLVVYSKELTLWKASSADCKKSYHQARALIELVLKLRSGYKDKLTSGTELAEQILWLGESILCTRNTPKANIMHKIAKQVYKSFFQGQEGSKATLLAKSDSLFSVLQLGYLLSDLPGDSEIIDFLTKKSNQIAFNDKYVSAFTEVHFFKSFYQQINEEVLLNNILPAAQLACKRQERFIENVAFLVDQLKFEVSVAAAKQLIPEILSKETLAKPYSHVASLLTSVCKKLDKSQIAAFETQVVRNYLLSTFSEANQDVTLNFEGKIRTLNAAFACLKALGDITSSELTNEIAIAFLKLLFSQKEDAHMPTAIIQIFKTQSISMNNNVLAYIETNAVKIQSATQANFIGDIINERYPQAWKDTFGEAIQRILLQQNFSSTINYSFMLALLSLLLKLNRFVSVFNSESQVSSWLTGGTSVVTRNSLFDKLPNLADVTNHVDLIATLLYNEEIPLFKAQTRILITGLIEYATNEAYTFRGNKVYKAFEKVAKRAGPLKIATMIESLFSKQNEIVDRPQKKQVNDNERKQQNVELHSRVVNCQKILVEELIKADLDCTYDQFTLILQVFCHPLSSPNLKELKSAFYYLEKTFKIDKLQKSFQSHSQKLIEQFLKRRTGILSENPKVRHISKNVLVLLSWAGQMELILPQMVPIFDYKPIQMLNKMEVLLQQEFDRISHYDLMFFSEMSKDLLKLFGPRDAQSNIVALRQPKPEQTDAEEEKKDDPILTEEPTVEADLPKGPIDFAAAMKARKAAAKSAKKGKKAPKADLPKPSVVASAPSREMVAEKPVETKEERNKSDRKQLLLYVEKLRQMKAAQIATCQEILLQGNDCALAESLNYQDKTLNFTINSLLKLLNLSATRFSSQFFLDNLLNINPNLPFFKIKTPIITCLMAIAIDKLTSRTTQEFQNCLVFLDQTANFSVMEGGYLKLTLTIANYVLKDPSVNLSVKEIGLQVTQAILDSNTEVETIDIVRLTINMLRTNYISNNLGLFIRKLMQRCSRLEIALLLQRLFEYQPVPRKTLLQEILNYDEPLFCPVWLQTILWVLLSDEDLSSLARKIWNKFGFYLSPETVSLAREKEDKNMFYYLRSPNFSIFELTVNATACAIELFQFMNSSSATFDLIKFYDDEWKIIEQLSFEATDDDYNRNQKVQMGLIADDRVNRIAVPKILKLVARFIKIEDMEAVLTFLITKACLDQNEEICTASSAAAMEIIHIQAPTHGNAILAILESFVKNETGAVSNDAKTQALDLLATLAPFLEDTSAKKLQTTLEQILELSSKVQSEKVRQSACKCIPQLAKFMPEKAKSYLREQIQILQESTEELKLKGSAYNAAGLVKARGLKAFQEMDVVKMFEGAFAGKRADYIRKVAALNFFETLSYSMGKSFELYLDLIFPLILSSISDQKEQVRTSAVNALKRIMANFSNHAIKQALPQFLKQLETDNWRSKISTVEALGNMAYCAPKQISGFLPQIVKGLREVMNDTHEKVHEAAIQAISKIGSVIKCPEVGDMLEIIIRALSDTTKHLKEALNLLLETSFVHKIDAPSLSLLVPLLDCGLMMHDNQSKQMAAQLMGNICSLTSNPSDLLPYMSILMPAIKNSLFDSIPEIRGSAAKAMGSLAKGLGIENSEEMLGWIREHLNSHNALASERLGSAQGFANLISAHGIPYFEVNVEEVIIKANDPDGEIREAYRSVLLFLASSFDKFVDYLPKLVPIMIQGLADEKDEVRKVSMRNVKICIKQFGKVAPNQLVAPVKRMMFSHDSRVRASSSILMFSLVKELENDVIKAQPKYISIETKHQILSSMFILRYDEIDAVKQQAGQIWKSIVDNQLFILRQVIDTLIHIVFQNIQSNSEELIEMGLSCMRGLVEKFGEKLVNRALDIFENLLDTATESNQAVGICKVMYNMVSASTHRLLTQISPRMISIMEANLSSENDEIREWSSKVFITMFQRQPEKQFIDPTLDKCILYKLKMYVRENRQEDADRLILSLKLMVEKSPELRIQDKMLRLCEITKRETPFSIAQAQVLKALAPTIAKGVFHKRLYMAVMTALEEELKADEIDDRVRIQHVLMAYAELMSYIPTVDSGFLSEELIKFYTECKQKNRPEFYVDFISHFCVNTNIDIEPDAPEFLDNVLRYMNHSDPKLIEKVIAAMNSIFNKVSKETQFAFVPRIKESIENECVQFVGRGSSLLGYPMENRYQKKVAHLGLLAFPEGVKCLVEVAQAAIMHGNIQVRTDAAFCFKYILDFAPELGKGEIVKICGALIRVANDRFPQELKLQIYYALKFIQTKGGPSAKGFQVNMQTTYTKAIGDPQSILHSRQVILENLLLLIQQLPRIDPIVKDLNALLDGSKLDGDQKNSVSECLALIIRQKGKVISSAISQTIYKTMTDILSELNGDTNDRVFCNCATALAFLSAYASDASQMQTLFNAYDENAMDAIMIPLKFAILINGNDTIDKSTMTSQFESFLIDRLTDSAGFEEIDDDPSCLMTEDEIFRFQGVLGCLAFMLDKFARRSFCQKPGAPAMKMIFRCINQSTILKKLKQEDTIGRESYQLLCHFASIAPLKPVEGNGFTDECAETIRDLFDCIQKFYLDHLEQNLEVTQDAIANILQINYDNYTDYSDDLKIVVVDKPLVKAGCDAPYMQGVISDDMKLYSVDIMLKKK